MTSAQRSVVASAGDAVARSRDLLDGGDPRGALSVLAGSVDGDEGAAALEELVRVRHLGAGPADAIRSERGPASTVAPDAPAPSGDGIPEIDVEALDATTLAGALRHRGCLLVRGLIPQPVAEQLRGEVDQAVEAAQRSYDAPDEAASTSPWYVPFEAHESYDFGAMERAFARHGDGLLTVDSPIILQHLIQAFEAARVPSVLEDYFGERPMLSAKKSTLRGAGPTSLSGWHQDGSFLGVDTKAVNIWLALTPCGVEAPSIDIFDRSFVDLVPTGSADAHWDWSVGQSVVDEIDRGQVHRPVFAPGDALLFDHLSLHKTGVDPAMTEDRIAVESWFFAPSTYPEGQVPLLL